MFFSFAGVHKELSIIYIVRHLSVYTKPDYSSSFYGCMGHTFPAFSRFFLIIDPSMASVHVPFSTHPLLLVFDASLLTTLLSDSL